MTRAWYLDVGQIRKGLLAVSAVIGVAVSQGLLSGTAEAIANVLVSAVGAVLVILVPNATAPAAAPEAAGYPTREERGDPPL